MTTSKTFLQTLSILHLALLAGPFLAGIFLYLNTDTTITNVQDTSDFFIYIVPIIGLAGIFASKFAYRILLAPLKSKKTLQQKLAGLQSASLIQYALIEGPALLNIIWFGQTGNVLYLTVGGVLLLYLFVLRPTKTKVETDLELKGDHKRQFDNNEQLLP